MLEHIKSRQLRMQILCLILVLLALVCGLWYWLSWFSGQTRGEMLYSIVGGIAGFLFATLVQAIFFLWVSRGKPILQDIEFVTRREESDFFSQGLKEEDQFWMSVGHTGFWVSQNVIPSFLNKSRGQSRQVSLFIWSLDDVRNLDTLDSYLSSKSPNIRRGQAVEAAVRLLSTHVTCLIVNWLNEVGCGRSASVSCVLHYSSEFWIQRYDLWSSGFAVTRPQESDMALVGSRRSQLYLYTKEDMQFLEKQAKAFQWRNILEHEYEEGDNRISIDAILKRDLLPYLQNRPRGWFEAKRGRRDIENAFVLLSHRIINHCVSSSNKGVYTEAVQKRAARLSVEAILRGLSNSQGKD